MRGVALHTCAHIVARRSNSSIDFFLARNAEALIAPFERAQQRTVARHGADDGVLEYFFAGNDSSATRSHKQTPYKNEKNSVKLY